MNNMINQGFLDTVIYMYGLSMLNGENSSVVTIPIGENKTLDVRLGFTVNEKTGAEE